MKKQLTLLLAALLTAGVFSGCRRSTLPMIPETTAPLATIRPTEAHTETTEPRHPAETVRPAETRPSTEPRETSETMLPPGLSPTAEPESTIEDGNGPIASQIQGNTF